MNKVNKLRQLANFTFYIVLQLAVARFIILGHTALCFVYVNFLLLLPCQQSGLPLMLLISFSVGLFIDIFYHSMGVHAFASVLMVYSKAFLLQRMLPTSSYEVAMQSTISNLGWRRFSLFSLVLIGIHHTALFLLEASNAMLFFVVMRKALFSTLLTCAVTLVTQCIVLLAKRS